MPGRMRSGFMVGCKQEQRIFICFFRIITLIMIDIHWYCGNQGIVQFFKMFAFNFNFSRKGWKGVVFRIFDLVFK